MKGPRSVRVPAQIPEDVAIARLLEERRYEETVSVLEGILAGRPQDPVAHYYLGVIYSEYLIDEDEAKAAKHFRQFLEGHP